MTKKLLLIFLGLVIIIVIGLGLWFGYDSTTLKANGHSYKLLVVKSAAAQAKGLGDRASLPTNEGMLFVFSNQSERCFWMKDMSFPLDMLWLNADKQVVAERDDISPNTYPETFCPVQPAQYVIELNAGQAAAAHIIAGQKLTF